MQSDARVQDPVERDVRVQDPVAPDARVQDTIVESIVAQFRERSRVGQAKYGTTLDRTDLKPLDWIQHAQEELMDGILYLEKLKKELQAPK
jgi:hypothetical protein